MSQSIQAMEHKTKLQQTSWQRFHFEKMLQLGFNNVSIQHVPLQTFDTIYHYDVKYKKKANKILNFLVASPNLIKAMLAFIRLQSISVTCLLDNLIPRERSFCGIWLHIAALNSTPVHLM